jgi:hypothetical protein
MPQAQPQQPALSTIAKTQKYLEEGFGALTHINSIIQLANCGMDRPKGPAARVAWPAATISSLGLELFV